MERKKFDEKEKQPMIDEHLIYKLLRGNREESCFFHYTIHVNSVKFPFYLYFYFMYDIERKKNRKLTEKYVQNTIASFGKLAHRQ